MKLFRSKSCVLKGGRPQVPPKQPQSQQQPAQRRFSLTKLKNRSREKSQQVNTYMQQFKQRILNYIELRSDVEIINFYNQYRQEFFRKSINLQTLLYDQPEIKHKYLSDDNPHFFKGFQQTLLNLYRKKVIVHGEFRNMRLQTVQEIEKWVFSWIQRQIRYETAVEDQDATIRETMSQLQQIKQYNAKVQSELALF